MNQLAADEIARIAEHLFDFSRLPVDDERELGFETDGGKGRRIRLARFRFSRAVSFAIRGHSFTRRVARHHRREPEVEVHVIVAVSDALAVRPRPQGRDGACRRRGDAFDGRLRIEPVVAEAIDVRRGAPAVRRRAPRSRV